jgi:hypothetical protein
VKSYRADKKQLDTELEKAISRLKQNSDRNQLMQLDEGISLDQVCQLIWLIEKFVHFTLHFQEKSE